MATDSPSVDLLHLRTFLASESEEEGKDSDAGEGSDDREEMLRFGSFGM